MVRALALNCTLKPSPAASSTDKLAEAVLSALDAELSETDAAGRPVVEGKLAVTAVVGNGDAAHKITADISEALADVGFSIPSQGGT